MSIQWSNITFVNSSSPFDDKPTSMTIESLVKNLVQSARASASTAPPAGSPKHLFSGMTLNELATQQYLSHVNGKDPFYNAGSRFDWTEHAGSPPLQLAYKLYEVARHHGVLGFEERIENYDHAIQLLHAVEEKLADKPWELSLIMRNLANGYDLNFGSHYLDAANKAIMADKHYIKPRDFEFVRDVLVEGKYRADAGIPLPERDAKQFAAPVSVTASLGENTQRFVYVSDHYYLSPWKGSMNNARGDFASSAIQLTNKLNNVMRENGVIGPRNWIASNQDATRTLAELRHKLAGNPQQLEAAMTRLANDYNLNFGDTMLDKANQNRQAVGADKPADYDKVRDAFARTDDAAYLQERSRYR